MEIAALKLADDYDALKSDLARVTAERDQLQSIAEKRYEEFRREANAHFVAAGEIEKLETRVAELDESLHLANGTADLALHHRDIAEQRVEELEAALVFIRDECDWEEPKGDFGGGGDRRIGPAIDKALDRAESATPAKHPDTEIVDWLDAQFQSGDDWCRLFPLGNTIREAYAARKQEVSRE